MEHQPFTSNFIKIVVQIKFGDDIENYSNEDVVIQ